MVQDLRLELAIAKDVGAELVNLCYQQESDAPLLSVTTFGHWDSVKMFLMKVTSAGTPIDVLRGLLPPVAANAERMAINHQRDAIIRQSSQIILPVYRKMINDSENRLKDILAIFGC